MLDLLDRWFDRFSPRELTLLRNARDFATALRSADHWHWVVPADAPHASPN